MGNEDILGMIDSTDWASWGSTPAGNTGGVETDVGSVGGSSGGWGGSLLQGFTAWLNHDSAINGQERQAEVGIAKAKYAAQAANPMYGPQFRAGGNLYQPGLTSYPMQQQPLNLNTMLILGLVAFVVLKVAK